MKRSCFLTLIFAAGLLASPNAAAQVQPQRFEQQVTVEAEPPTPITEREAYFTFKSRIALPGFSLEPGTYLFRVVGDQGTMIQVLSEDRATVHGMIQSMFVHRSANESHEIWLGKPLVGGTPQTLQAWFRPDRGTGHGFIFQNRRPNEQLLAILQVEAK